MKFTRNLKVGLKGEDVKYMQTCLKTLNYDLGKAGPDKNGIDGDFGEKTKNAVQKYQQFHKDINGRALAIDGIIGEKSWYAIERDYLEVITPNFTRNLRQGMSGEDVRYMKDCLFALEYYSKEITKISSNTFGKDTLEAVKKYQSLNKDINGQKLTVDGIIGKKSWDAIERDYKINKKAPEDKPLLNDYTHITTQKRKLIEEDLKKVDNIRQTICLELLNYACDPDAPSVRGLYIFGANLYDTTLKINYADKKEIETAAKNRPNYFSNGRKEWMIEQVTKNSKLPAADCSGMIVGMLRKLKLVNNTFDTTANSFCSNSHSSQINKADLKSGDWVGKDGHIGIYVGGGYVVEFYGGAYGCQLTELDNRRGWNFIDKKKYKGDDWSKYRRPKYY